MACQICTNKDGSLNSIMNSHKCQDYYDSKIPEPSCLITVSLLMDLYAELHTSRPYLAEKLKKCITGLK